MNQHLFWDLDERILWHLILAFGASRIASSASILPVHEDSPHHCWIRASMYSTLYHRVGLACPLSYLHNRYLTTRYDGDIAITRHGIDLFNVKASPVPDYLASIPTYPLKGSLTSIL
jgi:hypothetical protein